MALREASVIVRSSASRQVSASKRRSPNYTSNCAIRVGFRPHHPTKGRIADFRDETGSSSVGLGRKPSRKSHDFMCGVRNPRLAGTQPRAPFGRRSGHRATTRQGGRIAAGDAPILVGVTGLRRLSAEWGQIAQGLSVGDIVGRCLPASQIALLRCRGVCTQCGGCFVARGLRRRRDSAEPMRVGRACSRKALVA